MTRWYEPRPEQQTEWGEWVASLPDCVRSAAEAVFPWEIYRMKETGQIATLYSIGGPEEGGVPTVTVNNIGLPPLFIMPVYQVFGVGMGDIEPYEPGSPEELAHVISRACGDGVAA